MDKVSDVVGFPLQEAIDILGSEFEISIVKTNSPKAKEEIGECRVIRQKYIHKYLELTVSYF
ncbi:hypothetical protein [Inediibacterium massiliense]|uniref:hypothetical protein n=1 Tax=Inediibacterium massiliense TaxID=1658111 RepID=UPI0006B49F94|nr:hypothetical protein [Inediibacterium massiliense]